VIPENVKIGVIFGSLGNYKGSGGKSCNALVPASPWVATRAQTNFFKIHRQGIFTTAPGVPSALPKIKKGVWGGSKIPAF